MPTEHAIKPPSEIPAIRQVMMPEHTNPQGQIFGGVILSLIDQAAFVEALRQCNHKYATVAFKGVEFHQPVLVGDILSLYAETTRIGSTSITTHVKVRAYRPEDAVTIDVTSADVTMVAINSQGRPIPIGSQTSL